MRILAWRERKDSIPPGLRGQDRENTADRIMNSGRGCKQDPFVTALRLSNEGMVLVECSSNENLVVRVHRISSFIP
jgi:hypothetical protein